MGSIAEVLQAYGPWGVVVVCLVVIRQMAAYITKLHEEQRESDQEAMAAQREETKVITTALVEARDALRAFKSAMEAFGQKLGE